ncbi:Carbon-nitrogen hydrolase [Linnemannia elongata]|nr:Carbon-nitrogen hydrolase [Linnemannia elongata]
MQKAKIAVAQFCGGPSISKNLSTCTRLMRLASAQGAKLVFFPEASDFIGNPPEEALTLASPIGSLSKGRLYNTHVLISPHGTITQTYRKIHLFDVDIANGPRLMESNSTVAGDRLVPPVSTPVGKIGLSICYDLRFPEMALALRRKGVEILTYPSAFTVKTGEAHWEVLLRSRAIETQCYVVAAAQVGQHSEKRISYGHSMIVDPWGKVCAKLDGVEEGIAVAEVDLPTLERIRTEMPVLNHRRDDIFS